jgi:hypothetical protein
MGKDEGESVDALAAALARAKGSDVRAPSSDERFAVRARVTLVRTGGETTEVLELGPATEDGSALVRRVDDGAFLRVSRDVARRLEPHPAVLRGPSPWTAPFGPGSVVAIDDTCSTPPQRIELVDRTWMLRAPAVTPVDPVAVTELDGALAHARVDAWIAEADDGSFGLTGPGSCTVTVTLEASGVDAGPRRVVLTLGGPGEGGFYARTKDDPAVFVAPSALRRALEHLATHRTRSRGGEAMPEGGRTYEGGT